MLKVARTQRARFQDLDLRIEWPKGSKRPYQDEKGKERFKTMHADYGEVVGTKGMDGDPVDVYVGPNAESPQVFVVTQMTKGDWDKVDEQKCMLGFDSAEAAAGMYMKHYDDARFLGSIKEISMEDFLRKLATKGQTGKKIAEARMSIRMLMQKRAMGAIPASVRPAMKGPLDLSKAKGVFARGKQLLTGSRINNLELASETNLLRKMHPDRVKSVGVAPSKAARRKIVAPQHSEIIHGGAERVRAGQKEKPIGNWAAGRIDQFAAKNKQLRRDRLNAARTRYEQRGEKLRGELASERRAVRNTRIGAAAGAGTLLTGGAVAASRSKDAAAHQWEDGMAVKTLMEKTASRIAEMNYLRMQSGAAPLTHAQHQIKTAVAQKQPKPTALGGPIEEVPAMTPFGETQPEEKVSAFLAAAKLAAEDPNWADDVNKAHTSKDTQEFFRRSSMGETPVTKMEQRGLGIKEKKVVDDPTSSKLRKAASSVFVESFQKEARSHLAERAAVLGGGAAGAYGGHKLVDRYGHKVLGSHPTPGNKVLGMLVGATAGAQLTRAALRDLHGHKHAGYDAMGYASKAERQARNEERAGSLGKSVGTFAGLGLALRNMKGRDVRNAIRNGSPLKMPRITGVIGQTAAGALAGTAAGQALSRRAARKENARGRSKRAGIQDIPTTQRERTQRRRIDAGQHVGANLGSLGGAAYMLHNPKTRGVMLPLAGAMGGALAGQEIGGLVGKGYDRLRSGAVPARPRSSSPKKKKGRLKKASDDLSPRAERISNRIDNVGLGILAAPYMAKGVAKHLAHRGGRLGRIGGAAQGASKWLHDRENRFEVAGLGLVAPAITHRLGKGIAKAYDKRVPEKKKTAFLGAALTGAAAMAGASRLAQGAGGWGKLWGATKAMGSKVLGRASNYLGGAGQAAAGQAAHAATGAAPKMTIKAAPAAAQAAHAAQPAATSVANTAVQSAPSVAKQPVSRLGAMANNAQPIMAQAPRPAPIAHNPAAAQVVQPQAAAKPLALAAQAGPSSVPGVVSSPSAALARVAPPQPGTGIVPAQGAPLGRPLPQPGVAQQPHHINIAQQPVAPRGSHRYQLGTYDPSQFPPETVAKAQEIAKREGLTIGDGLARIAGAGLAVGAGTIGLGAYGIKRLTDMGHEGAGPAPGYLPPRII